MTIAHPHRALKDDVTTHPEDIIATARPEDQESIANCQRRPVIILRATVSLLQTKPIGRIDANRMSFLWSLSLSCNVTLSTQAAEHTTFVPIAHRILFP